MAFQMMHAKHRLIQRQTQTAGHRCSYQQGTSQARTLSISDRIDLLKRGARFGQHLFQ